MNDQVKIKDPVISQRVSDKLVSLGVRAPCHVTVASNRGNVTLSGMIQYEHQRHTAVGAARGVVGVQRVVDQMQVIPSEQPWKTIHGGGS